MAHFKSNLIPLFIIVVVATSVHAAPWPVSAQHSTHRTRIIGRDLQVKSFHPKSTYQIFGKEGIETPIPEAFRNTPTPPPLNESAFAFVQSRLSVLADQVSYRSGFTSGKERFAYIQQRHEDIPFANAIANVAWNNGRVVAFGTSFVNFTKIADPKPTQLLDDALITKIESTLDGKIISLSSSTPSPPGSSLSDDSSKLEYFVKEDTSVALTHVVQVRNPDKGTWVEAFVCAHTGEFVAVTDFVASASYVVLPFQKQTFTEGLETIVDPEDLKVSPLGWHNDGSENFTTTIGNNVASIIASQGTQTPAQGTQTGTQLTFNQTYTDDQDPTQKQNKEAAMVNAFVVLNKMHDLGFVYGFNEAAFNFQETNFGGGGAGGGAGGGGNATGGGNGTGTGGGYGNGTGTGGAGGGKPGDRVVVSVQDASGLNNANFATPPDGQEGVCRMFIWDQTDPRRDGAMENDILIHEMTHGITNRMTGGGTGRCLQTTEAGGMGEGWSDAMASWVSQKSGDVKDFVLGQYVTNTKNGIRTFPYSTDPKVNPLRYSSVGELNEVHVIGEVWANMLHNVYAALVDERGFSKTALTNPDTTEGNVVFMRLFMDGLVLQPCNPTFVSARDAWIQADENRYNGANKCTLFKAFASRGLGVNAGPDFVDNDDVPPGC